MARVLLLIIGIFAALATQYFRQEVQLARADMTRTSEAETMYLPPVPALRAVGLGYDTFAADLVNIRAYHYFLGHLFADRLYPHLDTYLSAAIALDPWNRRLYRWAAQAVKMGPEVTEESVLKSIDYGELGLQYFPDDWELYVDIAYNYYYELRPDSPEEKERVRSIARDYFATAASLPGSSLDPNYITTIFLAGDETELALYHTYSLYLDASEAERIELRSRIQEILDQGALAQLEERDAQHKRDFPFVSRPFFEHLGPIEPRKLPASWDVLDKLYQGDSDALFRVDPKPSTSDEAG